MLERVMHQPLWSQSIAQRAAQCDDAFHLRGEGLTSSVRAQSYTTAINAKD